MTTEGDLNLVDLGGTTNKHWAENASGSKAFRMMKMMGWKGPGVGLGKEEDGLLSHVTVDLRKENTGIGVDDDEYGRRQLKKTIDAFGDVLSRLQAKHPQKEVSSKTSKKKKKASQTRNGALLKKVVANKDTSKYSKQDFAEIFASKTVETVYDPAKAFGKREQKKKRKRDLKHAEEGEKKPESKRRRKDKSERRKKKKREE